MNDNVMVSLVVWLFLAAHVILGVMSLRYHAALRYLPWLNLVTAGAVVAYWIGRWYDIIVHGILWYGKDQLLPAYAIVVCIISLLAITRRVTLVPLHWTFFALHLVVIVGVAVFMTTFKMNRLF